MKVAVIGAGIAGICTAYELTKQGHETTVFEKNAAAAEGCSFASGGVLHPSLSLPLATPPWAGASGSDVIRSLREINAFSVHRTQRWSWLWRWSRANSDTSFLDSFSDLHHLARYSQTLLNEAASRTGFEFERSQGHLLIAHSQAQYASITPKLNWLKTLGVHCIEMDSDQIHRLEPSLAGVESLRCAWHFPSDEAINGRQYALLLKNECVRMGCSFKFGTEISDIAAGHAPTIRLADGHSLQFDAVVLCVGDEIGQLISGSYKKRNFTKIASYSLSALIREPLNAPQSIVTDLETGNVITRIGNRVRVCGGHDIAMPGPKKRPQSIKQLYQTLQNLFPSAVHYGAENQIWKGHQAFTSDGLPCIGTCAPGIWINAGHGANGLTLAHGCARTTSDLISGHKPEVEIQKFSILR
jgi:D-amino-acid dehydrogenase